MEIEKNMEVREESSDSGRFSPSSAEDSNLPVNTIPNKDDNGNGPLVESCREPSISQDSGSEYVPSEDSDMEEEVDDGICTTDSSLVTQEMVAGEKKMESVAVKSEELPNYEKLSKPEKSPKDRKSSKVKKLSSEKLNDAIKADVLSEEEKSYKRLMHLLSRSKCFTSYLLQKMEMTGMNQEKKTQNPTKSASSSDSDKNIPTSSNRKVLAENVLNRQNTRKRLQPDDAAKKDNPSKKKKRNMDYAISDILTKEAVEKVHRQHIEKETMELETNETEVDDATPEETKITSLGFTVSKSQPSLLEGGVLRDYQLKGLEWLKVLFENGVSGILADEMGLGKTIQVISLICYLIEIGTPGPYLIVAPLSTLSNWLHEFEKFAPQVPVVLFYGNAVERMNLYSKLKKPKKINDELTSVLPVVVTSYQVPLSESAIMRTIKWQYIIVDEGHRIKNKDSHLNRILSSCPSHNRLLLTGTPLQNNLTELWALLNFLLPDMFHDITTFNTWLDLNNAGKEAEKILQKEREGHLVSTLHQILFPFVLRRTKSDIIIDFPPKKEVVVYCPMTEVQMELYEFVVTKSLENIDGFVYDNLPSKRTPVRSYKDYFNFDLSLEHDIEGSPTRKTPPKASFSRCSPKTPKKKDFFAMSELPKCKEFSNRLSNGGCDVEFIEKIKMQAPHVALMHIVNHPYLARMPVTYNMANKNLFVSEDLIKVSGKFLVLEAMLSKLKQRGHKVLLFSTSCMLLDLLEEFMIMSNHTYVRLDGSSRLMDRKNDIHAFNTDPNLFLFLISTRAGGLGINLTGADTVILFNSDWNPMADLQAQDRAHRIGQTKPVVVYRLTVAGTIDEKIVQCGNNKKMMERIVMKSGAFKLNKEPLLDLQELATLLKGRKESSFVHSNPCGFSEEELEKLLDRSDLLENDSKNETTPQMSPRKSPRNSKVSGTKL